MAKDTSPTFVLSLKLLIQKADAGLIEKENEINRVLYNTCLGELLKRETSMKRTKRFKKVLRQYRAISIKLDQAESKKDKQDIAFFKAEKRGVQVAFKELRTEFGLTEYSIHAFMTPVRAHFGNRINANIAQKTATRAWKAFEKKLFGSAEKVKFKRKGEMDSFEGKTNTTGWMYQDRRIKYGKKAFKLKIKPNDLYLREALHYIDGGQAFDYRNAKGELVRDQYRVKYVRISREFIRGKYVYFAQLVCAGYPPVKRKKDGSPRHTAGVGPVGIDIGVSTVALASGQAVALRNLGEEIKRIDDAARQIDLLQRAMDRSKRATNPTNYNADGTIGKGRKQWTFSNRYQKRRSRLKSLHRNLAVWRKLSHRRMANEFAHLGNEFYTETMNFKALQKRAKKTEISEKTQKYKKKKRFGKSIAHRAPALFMSILEDKVVAGGGSFLHVDTYSFKASQYDHTTDACVKKELTERWHTFPDATRVQRDLYSAFLLMNAKPNGKTADRQACIVGFDAFQALHNIEINRIEALPTLILNSGIRLRNKKTDFVALT